ncbi:MAG: gliding motility-associated C-terminal domain-containing protein [Bacteroidales bacterium]|nr:gliding motility-associated C-terminal domain-containing protein [Bacteroidales bacterium]
MVLNGLPATGTWTINPGGITGTGTTTTISNLAPGTYNFTIWSDPGCISNASADIIINDPPAAPTAPVVGTITQPVTCAATTGSVVLTGLPATGTWTINPGAITGTGTSTTIANLIPGTYSFSVTSAEGCISNPSADVIINSPPPAPTAPIVGTVTQPSACAAPTGTVVLNGLPATGTWTINPGGVTGTGTTTTILNLVPGTYSFNVTSEAGCISLPSTVIVIISPPGTPATPTIGLITHPSSCASITGSVILNGLPPTETWIINPGSVNGTGSSATIPNLVAGTYNFTITIESGCTSLPTADVVINPAPGAPPAPVAGTIIQPTSCSATTATVILNGLPATGPWIITPGSITGTGTSTTITGLTGGTYNFIVSNAEGCSSAPSADIIIDSTWGTPIAPQYIVTDPTCSTTTGTITVTSDTEGLTFSFDGGPFLTYPAGGFTSVSTGSHTLTAQNSAGCLSPVSNITVSEQPLFTNTYTKEVSDYNGFNIRCQGQSDGFIRIIVSGAADQYSYSWTGPNSFTSSASEVTGLVAGDYSVIISDIGGCSATEIFTLTEPGPLGLTIETSLSPDGITNISCAGGNTGSITATAINGAGIVDYLWSDGTNGNVRTNLPAGTYDIIITDANNCRMSESVNLTEPEPILIDYEVTRPFCPDMPDGGISLTVTGGVPGTEYIYLWSDNSTGMNITNITSGTYTVTVTDANLCSGQQTIEVHSQQEICLILNDAISPNGDLINEVWNIGNINLYPSMEVTILNRWGQSVWKSGRGYPVPWDGKSNGAELPVDSYHYVIDLHNGSKPIVGDITIVR